MCSLKTDGIVATRLDDTRIKIWMLKGELQGFDLDWIGFSGDFLMGRGAELTFSQERPMGIRILPPREGNADSPIPEWSGSIGYSSRHVRFTPPLPEGFAVIVEEEL